MQIRSSGRRPLTAVTIIVGCLALLGVLSAVAHFLVAPYNPGFAEHPLITRTHVVLGAFYLALAPLQFSQQIRVRALGYHRWAGRALVGAATLVGLSALLLGLIVPFSGDPERVVIAAFGSLFLASLVLGVVRVQRNRIPEHREWMLRAFAIGLSVATMRLFFIPTLMIMPNPTDADIAAASVTCFTVSFLIHTVVAEIWIRRTRRRPTATAKVQPSESANRWRPALQKDLVTSEPGGPSAGIARAGWEIGRPGTSANRGGTSASQRPWASGNTGADHRV